MLLTEKQAAAQVGLAPNTLARWRCDRREGPHWVDLANPGRSKDQPHAPIKLKPIIRYPQDRLKAWSEGKAGAA